MTCQMNERCEKQATHTVTYYNSSERKQHQKSHSKKLCYSHAEYEKMHGQEDIQIKRVVV